MKQLLAYDQQFLRFINNDLSNPFFDWLMPLLRTAQFWYPLYLFLVLLAAMNFRRSGWIWLFFFFGTIFLCDFVSANIFKTYIVRLRPCNEPEIADWINVLVGYRPQSYSFISGHATSHFGMASFLVCTLRPLFGKWPYAFFFWAFSIAFAQVYVGVHYPLDVICGGLIGILIGYLSGRSFNRTYGLQ
jgi:membrane-associated phospholipid phosphatase